MFAPVSGRAIILTGLPFSQLKVTSIKSSGLMFVLELQTCRCPKLPLVSSLSLEASSLLAQPPEDLHILA